MMEWFDVDEWKCSYCKYHYVGRGWHCASVNKSLGFCRGNKTRPSKNRKLYKRFCDNASEYELIKKGEL